MNAIQIYLNGKPASVPGNTTLQQALSLVPGDLPDSSPIATALNGQHVARRDRARTSLSEGDQITTFEPITGG